MARLRPKARHPLSHNRKQITRRTRNTYCRRTPGSESMDARTTLRKRVGDTPLVHAPSLAKAANLPNLRLKMEGANPTGTQKDRVARLEIADAKNRDAPGITVASCGNFGVAIAHAAYLHELPCRVFVPEDFQGERVTTMEDMGATVERVPGSYEDAVQASRQFALAEGWYDANPGGANTQRTLVGYATISREINERSKHPVVAVGAPIGNGSTLAGIHLGFRTVWAAGGMPRIPYIIGGSSANNNPLPVAVARRQDEITPLDPRSIVETPVNEPLVNWDALDGQACLTAIQDSGGSAYGIDDEELLRLHTALREDGVDAHPASLSAVAALAAAADEGTFPRDAHVVAVLTSGRPSIEVERLDERPEDFEGFIERLSTWLGRFGDPKHEMRQAVQSAFDDGHVLVARDVEGHQAYCVLTPMELSEFFPRYHLSYIAVDEASRGRGLGTILLEEAIRITDGDLSLHVETDNEPAIRLYEKFGFQAKYYRMLYKGHRAPSVDPATGSGWNEEQEREQEEAMVTRS